MQKIWLILKREYSVRVRKKSFIIMTFLGPIFFALLMIVPIWLATYKGFSEEKVIEVIDESNWFGNLGENSDKIKFVYTKKNLEQAKKDFKERNDYALLYIPKLDINQPAGIKIFSSKNISVEVQSYIEKNVKKILEEKKLQDLGIAQDFLKKIKPQVQIDTFYLGEKEQQNSSEVVFIIGFVSALLIYMSVFLYGVQVMRGIIEEKQNRIVEVIISSVKPIQLMLGKIIGIALVGLTQFTLWIVLTILISTFTSSYFQVDRFSNAQIGTTLNQMPSNGMSGGDMQKAMEINKVMNTLSTLNIPWILFCFLFYFLGGYLLYSAMFAAVGSAADNETDSQQFTLPISLPLIIAFVVAQTIVKDPEGSLAFWLSMIPLTSPVIMMVRIPYGVPLWEILLSMTFLVIGFVTITWLAARIYRVGILMYGKKVKVKDLIKWLFYKI